MMKHLKKRLQGIEYFQNWNCFNTTSTLDLGLWTLDIPTLRNTWFKTSFLLDQKQTKNNKAKERFDNYKNQALQYTFPSHFTGKLPIVT